MSKHLNLPIPMPSGGVAILQYMHPMSEEDYEWMMLLLAKVKSGIVRPHPPRPEEDEDADLHYIPPEEEDI